MSERKVLKFNSSAERRNVVPNGAIEKKGAVLPFEARLDNLADSAQVEVESGALPKEVIGGMKKVGLMEGDFEDPKFDFEVNPRTVELFSEMQAEKQEQHLEQLAA